MSVFKHPVRLLTGFTLLAGALAVTGCANIIPAASIKPGYSNLAQVEQAMGKPDMTWRNADGRIIQAAYSNQPAGFVTFMVSFDDKGTVTRLSQVMSDKYFGMIQKGMSAQEVHKVLGPERSVEHFDNLHQIDWNYGYCSDNDGREVFSVSFDDRTMRVSGSVTTPDLLFMIGDNDEGPCVQYNIGETYER